VNERAEQRYRTIVADPPWDVKAGPASGSYKVVDGKQVWNLDPGKKTRDLAYPPMKLEAIKALPVADLAEPDAHLYLWTTNGYLPHAFDVIRAWGFAYSTTLVWAKTPFGGGGQFVTENGAEAHMERCPALSRVGLSNEGDETHE
jgi:hypothetical protein